MSENIKNISAIRDHIIDRVLAEIPYSRVNGDRTDRLPGNVHFCFRFIEGESMLIMLDQKGICGSSGSACTSGSLDPSHVLLAIGLPHEIAHGSLRLSLGEDATIEDADYVVDELKSVVRRKFPSKEIAINKLLMMMSFEYVYTPETIESGLFDIRDVKDYPVLYTAIIEDVDILVTGDKDFSDIDVEKPEIMSPAQFMEKFL